MEEKVVLVTGASSGIGRWTAILLNREGFNVYAVARRVESMTELSDMGINVLYMDIENEKSVGNVIKDIIYREGRVDVLINNAGFGIYGTLEDVPISEARRQFEVNVFGMALVTQLILPHMRAEGSGKIINLSSVAGLMSMPLGTWYHASKHAVEALSDSLRAEVAPYGIDVVVIEPGIIDTEWWPIAEKNLEQVSGGTHYRELVERGKDYLSDPGKMSDAEEVAKEILKAIEDDKPKTRYKVGEKARLISMTHSILSDRQFDRLMERNLEAAEDK